ncbi:IS66 family insertion sequence element accessory protein TnpA [Facilibium subflavum]|uniref:IS66 family insertion sequence element accessory protein TnpA n=1 Tax=Facilibium subflavum TaxID=2219058 RepID=UPI000E651BC8|nr:hypothetical protein [Facilibium subflavum]
MTETQSKWLSIIRDWEVSGLTQDKFCQEQEVSKASFSKWRTKFIAEGALKPRIKATKDDTSPPHAPSGFIPFHIDANTAKQKAMIEIDLPFGITLRVPCDVNTGT